MESPFSRWVRNEERLDSVVRRLSIIDNDYWCHKYAARSERPDRVSAVSFLDLLMLVEVKTFNSDLGYAQADTLQLVGQVMAMATVRGGKRRPIRVKETRTSVSGLHRLVRWYGFHLLQMSGDSPPISERILWDRKPVTVDQVIDLLSFVLDPDHPSRGIDTRRHHVVREVALPLFDRLRGRRS